jgi:putative flippase GtrA
MLGGVWQRVTRFVTSGLIVTGIQAVLVVLGLEVLGMGVQSSLVLAYAAATAVHFTLNRQWVFAGEAHALRLSAQGIRYLVLVGVNYAVTATALAILPGALEVDDLVVYAGITLVLAATNFLVLGRIFRPAAR